MKKTYIIYSVIAERVTLFLNSRQLFSGYISSELLLDAIPLGNLLVYEGVDTQDPVEELIFCYFRQGIPPAAVASAGLRGDTIFPLMTPPLEEMSKIQAAVIPFVLRLEKFSGFIRYQDKKRSVVITENLPK